MNEPSSKPWRAMLEPFRVSASGHLSPEEGFAQTATNVPQDKELGHERNIPDSRDVSILEIEFVSRLVSKCCYFLSYNCLSMRIASCDALIAGFRFLAFVACLKEVSSVSAPVCSFCPCRSHMLPGTPRLAPKKIP